MKVFFTSVLANGFSLEFEWQQISSSLFSLQDSSQNYDSLISNSSSPFTNYFEVFPTAPITISVTVTFMFHFFFLVILARSKYLCLFFFFAFF